MKRRMERRIFVVNFSADFVNLKNGSFPTGGLSQNEKKVRERERKSILVIAASVRLSLPSLAVSLSLSTSATFSSISDPLSLFLSHSNDFSLSLFCFSENK